MRQLIYALQFIGQVRPVGDGSDRLRSLTRAGGCAITTITTTEGVGGTIEPAPCESAVHEAELTFAGETTFGAMSSIEFGPGGHRLRLRALAPGRVGPSADPKLLHGAIVWEVAGGEGQFAGASGVVASTFLLSPGGTITDYHVGVLFVR
jgi:hypothetical protein